ncbi:hypothetical protein [Oscillatoria sp. FACHB-1406]|uniref:hypothetical protein n=1 Tax=Oscillatoria sp. FACHB-1406 TaxID=2692846 RepID=UPI00168337DD|nr:hypothetical protein [Oscillatoria sp. FACHB-1406]MBD2578070.1 hypothetical protein [Oscillatoria sp. FACHB-1406]
MMEILTLAAAQAIAKIALDKFIEGGAGELGKNMTGAVTEKVKQLGTVVWNRIKGNHRAVEVLQGAAENKPEALTQLKNYLYSQWQDENSEFVREVKTLADDIHFELTQIEDNSPMTVNNYGGTNTNYQTKTGKDNTNYFGGTHNHGK